MDSEAELCLRNIKAQVEALQHAPQGQRFGTNAVRVVFGAANYGEGEDAEDEVVVVMMVVVIVVVIEGGAAAAAAAAPAAAMLVATAVAHR